MYNKKILVLLMSLSASSFSLMAMEGPDDEKKQTNQSLALNSKTKITCNDSFQSELLRNQMQFAQLRATESFNANALKTHFPALIELRKKIGGDDILDQDRYYDSEKEKTFGDINKKNQENKKKFFEATKNILKGLVEDGTHSTKEENIKSFEEGYNKIIAKGNYTPSQFFNNLIVGKISLSGLSFRSISYLSKDLLNTADSNYKEESSYNKSAVNIIQRNNAGENIAFLNPDSSDSKKIMQENRQRFEKFNSHVDKISSVIVGLQEALKSYYENDKMIQKEEEEMCNQYLENLLTLQQISSEQIECYKKFQEINDEAKNNNIELQQKIKDGEVKYKTIVTKEDLPSLENKKN